MTEQMNEPTVSVIMPTYNRARLISRAIKSVLNQTYQDFEIIVVDDGSKDNTADMVKSFDNKKIRYIKLGKNKGAAAARNIGINAAKGEFIAFQDSDDEWHHEKLKMQMNEFETTSSKIGVIYTGIWRIKSDKKNYVPSNQSLKKEGNIHETILRGNFVALSAAIVKRKCFSEVGLFDEMLPCLQDWELWIRISNRYDFKYLKEPLVNAYYVSDSISIDYAKLIVATEYILNKHFDEFKKNKKALARRCIHLAYYLCLCKEIKKGRKYLMKALKEYPFYVISLVLFIVSFSGQKTRKNLFMRLLDK